MATKRMRGPIGGSAGTGGTTFGAAIAAWACVHMLRGARSSLPWALPHAAFIHAISSENESEVDDLVLELMPSAKVYIQCKHGLNADSEFRSALAQMARQFADTGFQRGSDRLVIVTDHSASGSIRNDLVQALSWFHEAADETPLSTFPHGEGPSSVLRAVKEVFDREYSAKRGLPLDRDWRDFLRCFYLTVLDPMDGPDDAPCLESLKLILGHQEADLAWTKLRQICQESGRLRRPLSVGSVEAMLARGGVRIQTSDLTELTTLSAAIRDLNRRQLDGLSRREQFDGTKSVERSALADQIGKSLADGKKLFVVAGGSGQGKTTWFATQCNIDDSAPQPRLMLPAELIGGGDRHFRDTLTRLLAKAAEDRHRSPFLPAEVKRWLETAAPWIFVDGLDRSVVSKPMLMTWLRGTADEIGEIEGLLVLSTRPEILESVTEALGVDTKVVWLGDFSEFEAMEVASRMGIPQLARYRHPRLMSFYARLWQSSGDQALRREQAVWAFIQSVAAKLASEQQILPEDVDDALTELGKVLARSQDGRVEALELQRFRQHHPTAYKALRHANILSVFERVGRLEIDDIAEHLAGRHIDIEAVLSRWSEVRKSPHMVGALRSALEQLAFDDSVAVKRHLDRLLQALRQHEAEEDQPLLMLLCSLILAHDSLTALFNEAREIATKWRQPSLFLYWGAGLALVDMLASHRWPVMQRLELLWELAHTQNGFDWRPKEWRSSEEATGAIDDWRGRFATAVLEAGADGMRFLLHRFDATEALQETTEANLGDLAKGMFFSIANTQMREAISFLAANRREDMLDELARGYPKLFGEALLIVPCALPMTQAAYFLDVISKTAQDDGTAAAAATAARVWLANDGLPTDERRCLLRALAREGDVAAGHELVRMPNLECSDVAAICSLPVDAVVAALGHALERTDVVTGVFESLVAKSPEHVGPIAEVLLSAWSESPPDVLGRVFEALAYAAERMVQVPPPMFALTQFIVDKASAEARCDLMVFATQRGERPQTPFSKHVLDVVLASEADPDCLRHLASRILDSNLSDSDIEAYIGKLEKRHPGVIPVDELRQTSVRFLMNEWGIRRRST